MLRNALIYLFVLSTLASLAQTRRRTFRQKELGFYGGASYYLGDINPRRHFTHNHPAAGIFFRYTTNYRYAFRFGFNYGKISGSDADSGEPNQLERNVSFQSPIYELHALAEFNFVDYRIGHDRHRFTMFVFLGLNGNYTKPVSDIGSGFSSGQSATLENTGKKYKPFQMGVPFGVGVKFNLGDKCGLGFEWGPRKTFTDLLDDVSGAYGEGAVIVYNTPDKGIGHAPGSMRGNPTTKDWYFFYGVTLSIKLRESRRPCHAYGF